MTTNWQPIETAPKTGAEIIVNDTNKGGYALAFYVEGDEWSGFVYADEYLCDFYPLGPKPTLWFPIPPLP